MVLFENPSNTGHEGKSCVTICAFLQKIWLRDMHHEVQGFRQVLWYLTHGHLYSEVAAARTSDSTLCPDLLCKSRHSLDYVSGGSSTVKLSVICVSQLQLKQSNHYQDSIPGYSSCIYGTQWHLGQLTSQLTFSMLSALCTYSLLLYLSLIWWMKWVTIPSLTIAIFSYAISSAAPRHWKHHVYDFRHINRLLRLHLSIYPSTHNPCPSFVLFIQVFKDLPLLDYLES